MILNGKTDRKLYKPVLMSMMLLAACALTWFSHSRLDTEWLFTHLFYIPIVLSAIWWKRKGLMVALFLSGLLLASHILFRAHTPILNDFLRAIMFTGVGFMVAMLTEKVEKMKRWLEIGKNLYQTIFETTETATMIIEADTTIFMVNRRFETLSGYNKSEIQGKKHWTDFFIQEVLDKMLEYHYIRRIDSKAVPDFYKARFIDGRGNIRDVMLNVAVIPGTEKSVVSISDISELMAAREDQRKTRKKLEEALTRVLSGFIPICASCKRIRDAKGEWQQVEAYIQDHTKAQFSHSICPECGKKLYGDYYEDENSGKYVQKNP